MLTLEQFNAAAMYASNVRNPPPHVEADNYERYLSRVTARKAITHIANGDVVVLPDGDLRRVAWVHSDRVQLTMGKGWDASFAMSKNGHCQFSGSLSQAIPIEAFTATDDTEMASAWFFSQDQSGAFRSVTAHYPFRVWTCDQWPQ